MGLMNAIGLQPRHPAPSVTSQGTQTPAVQLQNAETQTDHDLQESSASQASEGWGFLQSASRLYSDYLSSLRLPTLWLYCDTSVLQLKLFDGTFSNFAEAL